MLKKILSITILCMILTIHGFAAEKIDFSYRGIELGGSYEEMVNKIGQPRMDISHLTDTAVVTYYIYGENNDTRIGIDEATKKVVDIRISDKTYESEKGVKIGATLYKLNKAYGKGEKERIGGKVYYIYQQNEKDRLMLDISQGYLNEIRITTLEQ
ncbi:hypothetical protein [Anaerosinus sp.]